MTAVIDRKNLQHYTLSAAHHLPWNYVGVMLRFCNDNLISFPDKGLAERKGNKIYRFCST
jgi:hypothetical protein